MIATMGTGHFGYYRDIEGGSAEGMATTKHFGLIGPEVYRQIPLANVDPNQSPMYQIRRTVDIAAKLKEEANNF